MIEVDTSSLSGRGIVFIVLLVGICGLALVGGAATVSAEGGPAPASDTGTLVGNVTDAATGDPVENVTVFVGNPDELTYETTTTGPDGSYELDLAQGVYVVGFVHPEYEVEYETDVAITGGETTELDAALSPQPDEDPALAFVDDPEAGANTDHFWGTLSAAEEERTLEEIELDYSGTGADLSGVGQFDIAVFINNETIFPPFDISTSSGGEVLTIGFDTFITNPPTVEPGDTVAVTMINDAVENPPTAGEYNASIALRNDTGEFTAGSAGIRIVEATGTIAGTVTDADTGEALDNATVAGVNATTGFVDVAFTDDSGSYDLTLPAGSYNVTVFRPEYQPALETDVQVFDDTTTTLDVGLDPLPPEYLVGVTDVTDPVGAGEELRVTAQVVNAGGDAGEQDVELLVDGELEDTATGVSLEPGETWEGNLTYVADESDIPSVNLTVRTVNDTAERSALVHESVPAYPIGDSNRNGEVSVRDSVLIKQHLVGMEPNPFYPGLADVNRDGTVSVRDSVLIKQYLVGMIDKGSANVTSVDASSEVIVGEPINVSATVTNTGGHGTKQAIEYRLAPTEDALGGNATRAVTVVDLGPDESGSEEVTIETDTLLPGTYYLEVVTDDDSTVVEVEVTLS